jgi:choline dehydrogenase
VVEFISESFSNTLSADFWPSVPLSRGHVHINTTQPFSYPIITPRFLSDAFDQQIAIEVARKSREMYASDVFAEIVDNSYYSPSIGANGTDEEYLEWYRNSSYGASHWIGSTSMLPQHLGGVVDPQLR